MNRPNPKRLFAAALIGAGLLASAGAANAAVSVAIGEPGFYGTIDLGGGAPPPLLINPQPIVAGPPVAYGGGPLYLRVAPGHERRWGYYCHRYNACGRPVYFVQDRWYRDAYVPHYRTHHGPPPGYYRREERREFRHEERREERRDERHDHHH
jgi:hypothetical protein